MWKGRIRSYGYDALKWGEYYYENMETDFRSRKAFNAVTTGVWIDGSKKENECPNVAVTLQIRSMYKEKFAYELTYDVNDILIIELN